MRTGSLFSGYGGLEMAVNDHFGASTAWVSDIDKGACKILAHRYPGVPNLGDITAVDWSQVEPVDILTGGYPCQPFSAAGRRQGVEDDRHLWPHVATGVGILRPGMVVFENVRGHLTLGFDEVLRDLSLLHYDATWTTIKAADVGAPHNRARIFIVGRNRGRQLRSRSDRWGGLRRDSRGWRVNAGPLEGCDDGQGAACIASDARDLRRGAGSGPTVDREQSRDSRLAAEWPEGGRAAGSNRADASGQVRGGQDRAGVPMDDRLCRSTAERSGQVDRADEGAGFDLPRDDSRGEPSRPGPGLTCWQADARCPTSRFLVGAGWGPVRTRRVLGTNPDQRPDGGRPNLRHDLSLLPTPAVNDMGEGKTVEAWDEWTAKMKSAHGNGNGRGNSLAIEAQRLLPTPVASEGRKAQWESAEGRREAGHEVYITNALHSMLLPTPTAADSAASGGSSPSDVTLTDAVVRTDLGAITNPRHEEFKDARSAEGRLGEDVRGVRGADGPQALRQPARGPDALPGAEDLLAVLRQHEAGSDEGCAALAGTEAQGGRLPRLRDDEATARASRGQEPGEQRSIEPDDALRELSPEAALAGGPGRVDWGPYTDAIRRWEVVQGRPAPPPTMVSKKGNPQLCPEFVTWLMGLPAGWVTDVPGITRNEALKALGNGVVPQQAAEALRVMESWAVAA